MGSFNWHDEETGWDVVEETAPNEPSNNNTNQPRSFRTWMLIALVLAAGILAWVAFWRVNSVEDELKDKVLESWSIIVASEADQDIELLTNQLSGRDTNWVNVQQRLVQDQKLTARAAILPGLQKTGELDPDPNVVFSPELTEAILSHEVTYTDSWGRELTLTQEETFRLGEDRWLLSPPDPANWTVPDSGEEIELERFSNRFVYFAVAADIELAVEIVTWFENRLDTLCLEGFFDACKTQQTPQIEIDFTPTITRQMLDDASAIQADELVARFPTPAIIGRPVADEDVQLLAEAYGQIFFERYLISLLEYSGRESGPAAVAINNFALTQVGGIPPLTPADYQRVWLEIEDVQIAFNQNRVVGESTGNIRQFMDIPVRSTFRLMVEYQMQKGQTTVQNLSEQLQAVENGPFFPESLLTTGEWDEFSRFVETRAALATTPNRGNTAAVD